MAISRTKLAASIRSKFKSPRELLRHLGIPQSALDADLVNVGQPSAGGGSSEIDTAARMRTALEQVLSGVDDERLVASFLKIMDEFAPTDRADPQDPNAARAAELAAGNDDDNLAQVRAHLKKAGLSDETIAEALRIAAAGGNGEAVDRLPLNAIHGGRGGRLSDRFRSPRELAGDAAAAEADFAARFPNAIVVGANYSPDRFRSRPASLSDRQMEDFNRRFGGGHIGTNG